jgi:hypothetical protein
MMNECDCYCDYDSESPEMFTRTTPRARKEHKCCECGDIIKRGEVYQYVKGRWDYRFDSYKTCRICAQIRKDYAPCTPFEYLWETLEECLGREVVPTRSKRSGK